MKFKAIFLILFSPLWTSCLKTEERLKKTSHVNMDSYDDQLISSNTLEVKEKDRNKSSHELLFSTKTEFKQSIADSFKKAIGLINEKRYKEAISVLNSFDARAYEVEDYRLYYIAKAHLMNSNPGSAIKIIEKLEEEKQSILKNDALILAGDAYFSTGQYDKATQYYEKAFQSDEKTSLRKTSLLLKIAQSYELSEKTIKAREKYAKILREFPDSIEAQEALNGMRRLVPQFVIPEEWKWDRVEKFEKNRLFEEALAELETIQIPKQKEEKEKYLFKKAFLIFKARKSISESLKILMKLISNRKSKLSLDAILLSASCYKKLGDYKKARVLLQLYLKRYPESKDKGDVLTRLLELDLTEGRWNFIVKNYSKFDNEKTFLDDNQKHKVMRALGFSSFLIGDISKALQYFDRLRRGENDQMEQAGYNYWYSMTLLKKGNRVKPAEILRSIIQNYPLSYYAMLSMFKLKEIGESIDVKMVDDENSEKNIERDSCEYFPDKIKILLNAQMQREAEREIETWIGESLKEIEGKPDAIVGILRCSDYANIVFRRVQTKFNKYLSYYPYKDILVFWKILYPLIFIDDVREFSLKFNVSPYLVMSVMRQESSFNSQATSLEGATGLMQIMPQTGQNISKLLGEEFDRFLLYDRRVNIKFGTYYLSRLLDKFGGNEILALASYNGGPRNVENWLKRRWTDQMDLFVELIPLEQTRNYVRRVLTSYGRYSFLYDKKIDNVLEIFSRRPLPNFKEDPSF